LKARLRFLTIENGFSSDKSEAVGDSKGEVVGEVEERVFFQKGK